MLKLSVTALISALDTVDEFVLSELNVGGDYLYENVYQRLVTGGQVRISELNLSAFDLDDVEDLRDLYNGTLEPRERKAEEVSRVLRSLPPVACVSTCTSVFV